MHAQTTIPANDIAPPNIDAARGAAADEGDDGWTIISRYSRAQAIEDGVLIDVTDTPERKEAGI